MSDRSNETYVNKVIPFPNLKDRLMEKGLEALKGKRFREALHLLQQAQELEEENEEIELGIVICLYELGDLQEAKEKSWRMLREDIGDYFQVLQIYLTILVQLGQYNEVETTIEAVLEDNSVPFEYEENLHQLLELSKKMVHPENRFEDDSFFEENLQEQLQNELIDQNNVHSQLQLIQSLKELNIRKYLPIFKKYLVNPDKHPIVKTMVLQLLTGNGVQDEIEVEKAGKSIIVIPSNLVDISENPFLRRVISILEEKLDHNNPTLFETAKDIWLRHLFVLFPFSLEDEDPTLYAAALHLYSANLQGLEINRSKIEEEYEVSPIKLNQTLEKVETIEGISFL